MVTAVIAGVLDLADSMIVMYSLLRIWCCVCKDSGPGIKKIKKINLYMYTYVYERVIHS